MERTVEVDRHDLRPGLRRIVPGLYVGTGNAGVIDQNIDAPERGLGGVSRALDLGKLGHVDRDRRDAVARLERVGGFLRELAVAVPDRDRRAGIEKPLDDCAPDALRPAGDDREPAGQIDLVGHAPLPASSRKPIEPAGP